METSQSPQKQSRKPQNRTQARIEAERRYAAKPEVKAMRAEQAKANRAKHRDYERKYEQKNWERRKELARIAHAKRQLAKPGSQNERARRWKEANPEKVKAQARKDLAKMYATPKGMIEKRLRARLRDLEVKGKARKHVSALKLIGCTAEEFTVYLEAKFKPGMTWENRAAWHIDHIRPCASFDLTKLEDQIACFHYTNLQPLWAKENYAKGDKIIPFQATA